MPDVIDRVLVLSKVDAFSQLTSEQLSLLALVASERPLAANATVYADGEPANAMFLVLEGNVALEHNGTPVATLGPGEDFGTWALFDPQPRVTSARAVGPVRLLAIERQHFEDLVADHPDLAHGLFRSLARRVRTLADSIEGVNEQRNSYNGL